MGKVSVTPVADAPAGQKEFRIELNGQTLDAVFYDDGDVSLALGGNMTSATASSRREGLRIALRDHGLQPSPEDLEELDRQLSDAGVRLD